MALEENSFSLYFGKFLKSKWLLDRFHCKESFFKHIHLFRIDLFQTFLPTLRFYFDLIAQNPNAESAEIFIFYFFTLLEIFLWICNGDHWTLLFPSLKGIFDCLLSRNMKWILHVKRKGSGEIGLQILWFFILCQL